MNLNNLNLGQLRSLEQQVNEEIQDREKEEIVHAREQIFAIARSVGIPLKDLIGVGVQGQKKTIGAAVRGKVAMRFRHPEHAELMWTGRGIKPRWVVTWIADGGTLDQLRIAD